MKNTYSPSHCGRVIINNRLEGIRTIILRWRWPDRDLRNIRIHELKRALFSKIPGHKKLALSSDEACGSILCLSNRVFKSS